MENKNYTIKDIARLAGVSAGTVDRVLHNRGDVSKTSYEKVKKVLDEIDYHPNMFAIGLAAKKKYTINCLIPYYIENDYWHSVALGIERAAVELRSFNVNIDFLFYKHADEASYREVCESVRNEPGDAILIAPNFIRETIELSRYLEENEIPYAFIDSNVKDTNALIYIGQESYMSGYTAAKILMRDYNDGQELALFLSDHRANPAEIQMQRRLEGFMQYINEHYNGITVRDVVLNKEKPEEDKQTLDDFFSSYPSVQIGAAFNSRVYHIGDYLRRSGHRLHSLVGYDLLQKNVELLKSGEVKYLIGQRPGLQGYCGVKALSEYIVFKKQVAPLKYMPIDILIKENIDYYFEFE